ncbi:MAG: OmpA family protein [Chitinophagaceae bacterium]|nr:OmpA family protein [Chitinophagaceae bacterium]
MKKFCLFSLVVLFSLGVQAQSGNSVKQDYTKGKALGLSFTLTDFHAASVLRNTSVVEMFKKGNFFNSNHMTPGLALNYLQGLSNHVDFAGSLGVNFVDYPITGMPAFNADNFYLEATGSLNLKLLSDYYWVTPFADLGVGFSKYLKNYAAFIPTGVGLQVNFSDEAFMLLNSQYRIPVTSRGSYHFYHSIGVAATIAKKKVQETVVLPPPPPPVSDRDGDGIPDDDDRCPDAAGPSSLKGCPDRDGDGIADIDDKCPDQKGVAKYQGCPIPDSDGDGINDEEDKCPNVPGVARYQGCPIPDSDGDGVNDEVDKCPNEAGPASNKGCPVVEETAIAKVTEAAKNVFFNTSSSKLMAKSYGPLNEVVQVLKDNPTYKISVDGYTDNTGKADFNQKLSEARAKSVKDYLVSKGIDESRITSAGHGIENPIADNNTAAGRAQNRRVEMTLSN